MSRAANYALFFLAVICILFLLHYYIYTRIEKIFNINKIAIISIFAFLTSSFIIAQIAERYANNWLTVSVYYLSSIWLGVLFLLISFFFVLDLVSTALRIGGITVNYRLIGIAVICIVAVVSAYSIINASTIKINKVPIRLENLDKDIKIVQLSDIHLGAIHSRGYLERVVGMTNKLNPDFVLITGDLFDGSGGVDETDIEPLKELKSTYGTYFITGNHEMYFGVDKALDLIKESNTRALRNEMIDIGGIQLIGIDYPTNEFAKHNEVLKMMDIDKNKPSVLMYHPPSGVTEAAEKGINIQLSGHIHNGQIFPFRLISRIFFKHISGLYQTGSRSYIYVSQGTGTWGPPMRFLSRNEITEIELIAG